MALVDEVTFAFLLSGPEFQLLLPQGFGRLPELSSPVDNGVGGRSFDFLPGDIPGIDEQVQALPSLQGRDGRTVEMFERVDVLGAEKLWWLKWSVSNGSIYSHLREEDGLSMGQVVADNLTVVTSTDILKTPSLVLHGPLRSGADLRPGYQEWATFSTSPESEGVPPTAAVETEASVALRRPGFLADGEVVQAPEDLIGPDFVIRAGTPFGIEIIISSDESQVALDLLHIVQDSLTEARPPT